MQSVQVNEVTDSAPQRVPIYDVMAKHSARMWHDGFPDANSFDSQS